MKPNRLHLNQKGFGLLEVLAVGAIFSILALSMSQMIIGQSRQAALLKDRVSYGDLKRELEFMIEMNANSCTTSLDGVQIVKNKKTNRLKIKDKDGEVVIDPASKNKSLWDGLIVEDIEVEDQNVIKNGGIGDVIVRIKVKRKNADGGLEKLRPIELSQTVELDDKDKITGCVGSKAEEEFECIVRDYKRYLPEPSFSSTPETWSFTVDQDVTAVELNLPAYSDSYRDRDGDNRDCTVPALRAVIFPGETKRPDGKAFRKGARVQQKLGEGVTYEYKQRDGDRERKTTYPVEIYYDGVKIVSTFNRANSCTSRSLSAPYLSANLLPSKCALKNGRYVASPATNRGFTFYKPPSGSNK